MSNKEMWGHISKFLDKFPNDAQNWGQATDEIRDIARSCRETRGLGEKYACDFRKLNTPSTWNTVGKAYIKSSWKKMTDLQKQEVFNEYSEWFVKEI